MASVFDSINNLSTTVKALATAIVAVGTISSISIAVDSIYLHKNEFYTYKKTQILDRLETARALQLANILQLKAIPDTERSVFENTELQKAVYVVKSIDEQTATILKSLGSTRNRE